ncbi:2Fe-2S iron-sulfur cluster-binding protein [Kineobactrum salinum]|uniref:2Fe-2S iron-sulfur cluster binding domain-containing protein n=1 Tax=Kineobactrum salinum TaxID=2708301 RepID=A0A6C0TZ18_9GAMM|nr:2Fe-2S iron-sulfur cluster-binding protein [Kineobactrum salinum]QIB64898.1 2Fe-2S iron-sulfur cluster binding domain-containing protein [Kineobactrum salinum]
MPSITISTRENEQHIVESENDMSLMEVIREAGIDEVAAICGGCCSCATCHVYIEPGFMQNLPKISEDEDALLDSTSHRNENSRLSCQVTISDDLNGMRVVIAPED